MDGLEHILRSVIGREPDINLDALLRCEENAVNKFHKGLKKWGEDSPTAIDDTATALRQAIDVMSEKYPTWLALQKLYQTELRSSVRTTGVGGQGCENMCTYEVHHARAEDVPCFYARLSSMGERKNGTTVKVTLGDKTIRVPAYELVDNEGDCEVILLPKTFRLALGAKAGDKVEAD